jgi:hypothetical protein
LFDRRRFTVASLGTRLLVFTPTAEGDLLLLQPRDLDNADTMVQEVVHSVMQVTL